MLKARFAIPSNLYEGFMMGRYLDPATCLFGQQWPCAPADDIERDDNGDVLLDGPGLVINPVPAGERWTLEQLGEHFRAHPQYRHLDRRHFHAFRHGKYAIVGADKLTAQQPLLFLGIPTYVPGANSDGDPEYPVHTNDQFRSEGYFRFTGLGHLSMRFNHNHHFAVVQAPPEEALRCAA